MPLPLAALGISAGAKLLGGLFGAKSKKKQAQAENKAAVGQAELKNQMAEDQRLAKVGAGQSILGQLAGKGFTNIDPATAAALAQRRKYDFSKAVPTAGAGLGSGLLSGLFNTVGDVASQYGVNQQDAPLESAGPPTSQIATQPVVGVKSALNDRGINYNDPYAD